MVSIRMGPSVIGKNRIPSRRSSRSAERRWGPDRSSIVRRPFGRESGASMLTTSGRAARVAATISASEWRAATRTRGPRPRKQNPVVRAGLPGEVEPDDALHGRPTLAEG